MSLKQLSEIVDIDVKRLEQIEAGKRELTIEEAEKIGDTLEVLSDELLGLAEIDDEEGDEIKMKLDKTVVIVTATNKGGEGKTSTTSNLGYCLAEMGYRVLLVDSDGQKNLTQSYGLDTDEKKNFYNALTNKESLLDHAISTGYDNLDIVTGDSRMKQIDGFIATHPLAEKHPVSMINPVRKAGVYDFVLIDTNPTISKLNTAIMCTADKVLIPLEAGAFGISGLGNIIECVNEIKEYYPTVDVLGILLNKVDGRVTLNTEVRDIVGEVFEDKRLATEISQDTNIKNAQWQGVPLPVYAKNSKASSDYRRLAREVLQIVKNN